MNDDKKAVLWFAVFGVCVILLSFGTWRYHEAVTDAIGTIAVFFLFAIPILIVLVFICATVAAVAVSLWWGLEWCWKKLKRKGGRA